MAGPSTPTPHNRFGDRNGRRWVALGLAVIAIVCMGYLAWTRTRSAARLAQHLGTGMDRELVAALDAGDRSRVLAAISKGADPYREEKGMNALFRAANQKNRIAVEALLEAKVDPNRPCRYGTPLVAAVWRADLAMLRLLLQYGAAPNGRSGGVLPLHEAVRHGEEALAAELLRCGADPLATDSTGKTARQLALEKNLPRIAKLIDNRASERTRVDAPTARD